MLLNPEERSGRTTPHRHSGLDSVLAAVLLVVLSLLPTAAVRGQEACQPDFREVREDYDLGRFHRVLRALEPCRRANLVLQERTEALSFLARTYLAVDDMDNAASAVAELLSLNPNYSPASTDSPRYLLLVAEARQGVVREVVSSVSKTPEALREAPATVIVLDAEMIERRGYLDLEALLHDLPGFDISRTVGTIYSSFYQRGYRSDSNDRTLFLVDGVENNDVWSSVVYLSRQYPLSSIDRVEVIYGPASTMYGPNAFLGVINVVTRSTDSYFEGDANYAVKAQVGGGSWSTQFMDTTVAGRSASRNVSFSLTTRIYKSDEMDLSRFEDWDYDDPDFFLSGGSATPSQPAFTDAQYITALSGGLSVLDAGQVAGLQSAGLLDAGGNVTATAVTRARERDQSGLDAPVGGIPQVFGNKTDDWSIFGKVRIGGVQLGFQSWRRREGGLGWYPDTVRGSDDNGNYWVPRFSAAYLKYNWSVPTNRFGFRLFSQFIKQELDDGNGVTSLRTYAKGNLDILDLGRDFPAYWESLVRDETSSQFRNEFTVVYLPSPRFSLVSGLEVRMSSLQGDYAKDLSATSPVPNEIQERVSERINLGQSFDQLDVGIFTQASYKRGEHWKFVLGGRLDRNQADALGGIVSVDDIELPVEGYGTVFNPRLAAIYVGDRFVFKAVYAEAFKDASNFNRYSLSPPSRSIPNPGLAPEEVQNFELSAGFDVREGFSFDVSVYSAEYSDAVALVQTPEGGQNRNVGGLEITGLQSNLRWQKGRYDLFANYTYSDPKTATPGQDSVRIGDIAESRLNFGANATYGENWNANLRVNYVGARETGESTSVAANPFDRIDAYTVANASISYDGLYSGHLRLQLVINNLLDEQYFHPGVRSASPGSFAARIPQNERSIFLRAQYSF